MPDHSSTPENVPMSNLKWMVIRGILLSSTYSGRAWMPEDWSRWLDPGELNDLCQNALLAPSLAPDHRGAVIVAHEALQGLLLLGSSSFRAEAGAKLGSALRQADDKVVAMADLKWLIIHGIELASGYVERDQGAGAMFKRPDAEVLNDVCDEALCSTELDLGHRRAILIAYQTMQAILLLGYEHARAKALAQPGIEIEVAEPTG